MAVCVWLSAFVGGMWPCRAMDTQTAVFSDRVRSLQVVEDGRRYAMPGLPVMPLDGSAGLTVSFDILGDDRDYLRYDLVHCNADWQPSQLAYIEYIDGFNEGVVPDGEFSQSTTVHYVHYTIRIPDGDMRPLVSGNYLLRVYREDGDADSALLQCRFGVTEQTADITAQVSGRTDVDYNRNHQQLSVAVGLERAQVRDPFNDILLAIDQNGRLDNAVTLDKPLRLSGKTLIYEHNPRLIFPAGNEYRRFETVQTQFPGMNVAEIRWIAPYYHAFVGPDSSLAGESYHYDETMGGAYLVREYNAGEDSDIAADYLVTHFILDYPELPGFDFYVDGDFVQRQFGPASHMSYDRENRCYVLNTLLKQGAYSYRYLAVPKGSTTGRTDITEGDKFETRNIYNFYVYHRRPGERYDRLIGSLRLLP